MESPKNVNQGRQIMIITIEMGPINHVHILYHAFKGMSSPKKLRLKISLDCLQSDIWHADSITNNSSLLYSS